MAPDRRLRQMVKHMSKNISAGKSRLTMLTPSQWVHQTRELSRLILEYQNALMHADETGRISNSLNAELGEAISSERDARKRAEVAKVKLLEALKAVKL
jgi:hypothetical protein